MRLPQITSTGAYAFLGAGSAAVGITSTNLVARSDHGAATKVAATGAVSSAAAGAFLRSSMAREPHLRPWAALFTGLGLGGIAGIGLTALENGLRTDLRGGSDPGVSGGDTP